MNILLIIIVILFFAFLPKNKERGESKNLPSSPPQFALKTENEKKFNLADSLPVEYQKIAKIFIFCDKTNLIYNSAIFEKIFPFMSVVNNNFDIEKENKEFYPVANTKIDYKKCQEYEKRLTAKFKNAGVYYDKKESDFILSDFAFYINTRYKLVRKEQSNKDKPIKIIYTDNIALQFFYFINAYRKKLHLVGNIIISNRKDLFYPDEFEQYNYDFKKSKKSENLLQKLTPDILENLLNEFGGSLAIGILFNSPLAFAMIYAGQKTIGKEKFNEIASNVYGLAGAVVSGVFLTPAFAPIGYKITKSQAKFVLNGSISPKEIFTEEKIAFKKLQESGFSETSNFDTIIFQRV